jgi:hypothetical protein
MAKISKKQLKSVVKECLVELLSEGLESNLASLSSKKQAAVQRKQEEQRLAEHRQRFEVNVDNAVSHVTDDPVMQSILQDTARTTLQEQTSNDKSSRSSMSSAPGTAGIDLDTIFQEPKNNWSKLAFDKGRAGNIPDE